MAAAKRIYSGDNKRQKFEYQCNECKLYHPQKEVQVDHIIPLGILKSYADLPGFVERLFVGVEGLQVLCSGCHNIKTQNERKERATQKELQSGIHSLEADEEPMF